MQLLLVTINLSMHKYLQISLTALNTKILLLFSVTRIKLNNIIFVATFDHVVPKGTAQNDYHNCPHKAWFVIYIKAHRPFSFLHVNTNKQLAITNSHALHTVI